MATSGPPMTPSPVAPEARGRSKSRLSGLRGWLSRRGESSLARLALLWFRRYFEASRNSGAAASAYITLSVLPCALIIIGLFNLNSEDESAFADRLIRHMRLDGETARIVSDLFGTTSSNLLAASIAAAIGFLIWGLSVGQLYQDLYARAWGVEVSAATNQLLFVIFFFVFSGVLAALFGSASELRSAGWAVAIVVWIVGSLIFWLFTPRFLLHRKVPIRSLLPGAALATFVVGGTLATSPAWIGPGLNENASAFGAFGVFLGLFAYILITITISLVCAVFAPVWAEWRQDEKLRKARGAEATDAGSRPATVSGAVGSDG
jgi:membrane protein